MSGLIVALTAPRALTLFDNKGRVSRYTLFFFFSVKAFLQQPFG